MFANCALLKTVQFAEGLTTIRMKAFWESGVEALDFPASLRTLERGAFAQCKGLKCVKFRAGLEILGSDSPTIFKWDEEGVF